MTSKYFLQYLFVENFEVHGTFMKIWACVIVPYVRNSSVYSSVSQPPDRGPVPGPGINYTGPREV